MYSRPKWSKMGKITVFIIHQGRIMGGLWGPRPPRVTKGAPKKGKGKGVKKRKKRKRKEKKKRKERSRHKGKDR